MLQAGFYECDITPPLGAECPGDFRKRIILKHSDPLKVRTLVLSDGTEKAALIGIDNIGCGCRFLDMLKAALPDVKIIFSASHTHYGGCLLEKLLPSIW